MQKGLLAGSGRKESLGWHKVNLIESTLSLIRLRKSARSCIFGLYPPPIISILHLGRMTYGSPGGIRSGGVALYTLMRARAAMECQSNLSFRRFLH